MAPRAESSFHPAAIEAFPRPRPRGTITLIPKSFTANPSRKHSFFVCAYLLAYVGVYLAIGFAGIAGISWLWMSMLK